MSSCSCMQLVSHMFAPRLRWPRDRDPDECNLQVRFATCSLAFICVFPIWQIPRNSIATPSLLGRSQTAQVRSRCVAQVAAHVRARASSQYACALHSTTCPRIASASARASGVAKGEIHVGQQPYAAVCVTAEIVLAMKILSGTRVRLIATCMLNRRALTVSRSSLNANPPEDGRTRAAFTMQAVAAPTKMTSNRESARRCSHTRRITMQAVAAPATLKPKRESARRRSHTRRSYNASGGGPKKIEIQTRISPKTLAHAPHLQCKRSRSQPNLNPNANQQEDDRTRAAFTMQAVAAPKK